jgi:alkylation response protein AidB-like acyl-CoA dehydrogenase
MDLRFSEADEEFRLRARSWLEENVPSERRPEDGKAMREFDLAWQRTQFDGGWAGTAWPKEYGGLGLALLQQLVWFEEYVRAGAPYMGCIFAALQYGSPTLMLNGTAEQQEAHLPKILRGEEVWSQGFSEPSGGSDLASLRTTAIVDGDSVVINGQKVWSSYADIADYQFGLFRSDPAQQRHRGLSWILVPLETEGIDVRPIKTMARNHHFCEVFYHDVRVPLDNVVGGVDQGWKVAMSTLGFERGTAFVSDQLQLSKSLDRLVELARDSPGPLGKGTMLDDDVVALELGRLRAATLALRSLTYRTISRSNVGGVPGPESSIIRLYFAELRQWLARVAVDVLGPSAIEFVPFWEDGWSGQYLWDFARTMGAGTAEIQRNVIGERVLGLPKD